MFPLVDHQFTFAEKCFITPCFVTEKVQLLGMNISFVGSPTGSSPIPKTIKIKIVIDKV
jgi:hypothetical protein